MRRFPSRCRRPLVPAVAPAALIALAAVLPSAARADPPIAVVEVRPGEEGADVIGLAAEGGEGRCADLEAALSAAEDDFYEGRLAEARPAFEEVVAALERSPSLSFSCAGLRGRAFESRVFLAMVARARGDEAGAESLLEEAASRDPDGDVDAAVFPPWVREGLARAREGIAAPRARLRVEAPPGCAAEVDGAPAPIDGSGIEIAGLGRHAVRVSCPEGAGPALISDPALAPPETEADRGSGESPGAPGAELAPWYEDGLAWGLTGGGLACLVVGIVLGQVYGGPSHEEPFAWAFMAAGSAAAGTGAALFPLPRSRGDEDGPTAAVRPSGLSVSF